MFQSTNILRALEEIQWASMVGYKNDTVDCLLPNKLFCYSNQSCQRSTLFQYRNTGLCSCSLLKVRFLMFYGTNCQQLTDILMQALFQQQIVFNLYEMSLRLHNKNSAFFFQHKLSNLAKMYHCIRFGIVPLVIPLPPLMFDSYYPVLFQ